MVRFNKLKIFFVVMLAMLAIVTVYAVSPTIAKFVTQEQEVSGAFAFPFAGRLPAFCLHKKLLYRFLCKMQAFYGISIGNVRKILNFDGVFSMPCTVVLCKPCGQPHRVAPTFWFVLCLGCVRFARSVNCEITAISLCLHPAKWFQLNLPARLHAHRR